MIDDDYMDIWPIRFGLDCPSYSSTLDEQIYNAAKLIVETREAGGFLYVDDLAAKLGITQDHAELIQCILAGIKMDVPDGKPHYAQCFTYGTSPRGLFVDDMDMAKQFLAEYADYIQKKWVRE